MKKFVLLLFIGLLLFGCKQSEASSTKSKQLKVTNEAISSDIPKLVIFISVDQLSEEMFSHYQDLYKGGYKWFIDNGSWFTNMHHEHRYTTTGPGHFVLGSGQHPYRGGVIGNYYYHRKLDKVVYCVDDTLSNEIGEKKQSYSYRQISSTTLGDWVKDKYPTAKVYSVAGKNRAAILLAGKNPDLAIWYGWNGKFVSSDYYAEEYPIWLTEYNDNSNLAKYRDSVWVREYDEDIYNKYAREDNFFGEIDIYDNKNYSPYFPIGFGKNETDAQVLGRIGDYPWLDIETLELANIVLTEEQLGMDNIPDILFIGLSATDVIGHNQGPFSQEGMDNQIKIDKNIQLFMNNVATNIDLEDVLFILTSDHGTIPLPEYLTQYKGIDSGRINRDSLRMAYDNISKEISHRFGKNVYVRDGRNFYYRHQILIERNIDEVELDNIIKSNLNNIQGLELFITKEEIVNADSTDKFMLRFKNFLDPILSPDLIALPKEYWTTRNPLGATHGTPYSYDSNVPLIIAQKGKTTAQIIEDPYATIDIAPTVAKLLRVKPTNTVDGESIF